MVIMKELSKMMASKGRSLSDFLDDATQLDSMTQHAKLNDNMNSEGSRLSFNTAEAIELVNKLNKGQKIAFEIICKASTTASGGLYFVNGFGGTRNTFLWKTLHAYMVSQGRSVICVGSSGIAALLLPNGKTAHSQFKIPINIDENSVCNIERGSRLANQIENATLIIWDETSMLSKYCFEGLDRCLRDIFKFQNGFNPNSPFGGKTVVLGGDFRQILPVVVHGCRADTVHATICSSYLWESCKVLELTENMRLQDESTLTPFYAGKTFAEWLIDIGDGVAGDSPDGESLIDIPRNILIMDNDDGLQKLVDFVYPNIVTNISHHLYRQDRAILSCTNDIVSDVNSIVLNMLDGDPVEYLSSDSLSEEDGAMEAEMFAITPEMLNNINCSGLPPHVLRLKVGALLC